MIKSGALIKNLKGKSIGGKALNDKPDMFMASLYFNKGMINRCKQSPKGG